MWHDVHMALPDLDQAWQQAMHGPKESSTHTGEEYRRISSPQLSRKQIQWRPSGLTVNSPPVTMQPILFAFSTRSMLPRLWSLVLTPPHPSHLSHERRSSSNHTNKTFKASSPSCQRVSMFRKTVIAVTARRHTLFLLKLQPLPSSQTASRSLSRTRPSRCCRLISLARHDASGASKNGSVKTALKGHFELSLGAAAAPAWTGSWLRLDLGPARHQGSSFTGFLAYTVIAVEVTGAQATAVGLRVATSRLVSPARCCCGAFGLPPMCLLQFVFDVP